MLTEVFQNIISFMELIFLFPSFIALNRNMNRIVYIAPLKCSLSWMLVTFVVGEG